MKKYIFELTITGLTLFWGAMGYCIPLFLDTSHSEPILWSHSADIAIIAAMASVHLNAKIAGDIYKRYL